MNLSDVFIGGAGQTVTVLNDQTFDTSGTWVKPAGPFVAGDMALIELWGGGGGGGGIYNATGGWIVTGGAGGSFIRRVVPVSSLAATQAVSIGAGGAGVASSTPMATAGGDTSFAGTVAKGGLGGTGYSSDQAVYDYGLNGYASAPGTTLDTPGPGGWGTSAKNANFPGKKSIRGGNGGDSASATGAAAPAGTAPGGGGGANRSGSSNSSVGGSGAPGRVRIRILRGLNQWEMSEGPL